MKWTILFIFLLASISHAFAEGENHCFKAIQKHITEAIDHNKIVAKRYSQLTQGESKRLSYTLINLERMSKLLVKNIERESRVYQAKGINLLCDELAEMKDLPRFQDRLPEELRPLNFLPYETKNLNHKLKELLKDDLLEEAYSAVAQDLIILENEPYQQCLTRHFLESIARTLKLSNEHRKAAIALGLPDPLNTIKKFITLQRRGLFLTSYLDTQAFPLQKEGLLIYCQDVPVIQWK